MKQQPVDCLRCEGGDDEEQLPALFTAGSHQLLERQLSVGLDGCQSRVCRVPVAFERRDAEGLRRVGAQDETSTPTAPDESAKQAARSAHLSVEAGLSAWPDDGPRSHCSSTRTSSLGASRSSFTISRPSRAVVGGAFRSDSPCSYSRTEWKSKPRTAAAGSAGRPAPGGVREECVQLRQPGVDEHRLERRRPCDDSLDPEMILERHLGVGHWVPAARGLAQLERALAVGERRLQGAPPSTCSRAIARPSRNGRTPSTRYTMRTVVPSSGRSRGTLRVMRTRRLTATTQTRAATPAATRPKPIGTNGLEPKMDAAVRAAPPRRRSAVLRRITRALACWPPPRAPRRPR